MRAGSLCVLVFVLSGAPPLPAKETPAPRARAEITGPALVVVGQPVTIRIEVLVPTFFRGAPRYPSIDLDGAITFFNERGTNFTERDGGRTWAGQRRSYTIYPNREGRYGVPAIPVEVHYGDGASLATDTASAAPLSFEATIPQEAQGLPAFVAAEDLRLEQSLEPRPDTLLVGEAFGRTITAEVDGTLSLVIPPFTFDSIPGLAVYPDQPRVTDEGGERGTTVVGSRTESVSYVAQEDGTYTLPPVAIAWWDWTDEVLRTAELPPVTFTVEPDPDLASEIELPPDSLDFAEAQETVTTSISLAERLRRWAVPVTAFLVLGALSSRVLGPRIPAFRARIEDRKARRAESEEAFFRRFRAAAASGDPRATANALAAWLTRVDGLDDEHTFGALARSSEDPTLHDELARLDRILYGRQGATGVSWSGRALLEAVTRARRGLVGDRPHGRARGTTAPLAPLNPR